VYSGEEPGYSSVDSLSFQVNTPPRSAALGSPCTACLLLKDSTSSSSTCIKSGSAIVDVSQFLLFSQNFAFELASMSLTIKYILSASYASGVSLSGSSGGALNLQMKMVQSGISLVGKEKEPQR
jgi:hypothetical protein